MPRNRWSRGAAGAEVEEPLEPKDRWCRGNSVAGNRQQVEEKDGGCRVEVSGGVDVSGSGGFLSHCGAWKRCGSCNALACQHKASAPTPSAVGGDAVRLLRFVRVPRDIGSVGLVGMCGWRHTRSGGCYNECWRHIRSGGR